MALTSQRELRLTIFILAQKRVVDHSKISRRHDRSLPRRQEKLYIDRTDQLHIPSGKIEREDNKSGGFTIRWMHFDAKY